MRLRQDCGLQADISNGARNRKYQTIELCGNTLEDCDAILATEIRFTQKHRFHQNSITFTLI